MSRFQAETAILKVTSTNWWPLIVFPGARHLTSPVVFGLLYGFPDVSAVISKSYTPSSKYTIAPIVRVFVPRIKRQQVRAAVLWRSCPRWGSTVNYSTVKLKTTPWYQKREVVELHSGKAAFVYTKLWPPPAEMETDQIRQLISNLLLSSLLCWCKW